MRVNRFHRFFYSVLLALCLTVTAHSSTRMSATRVIIYEQNKEGSIVVLGDPQTEFLIQTWIDAGLQPTQDNAPLPFAIVPNLVHLPPKQEQRLRILYQGTGLPADRESVFWLNVQEIPQSPDKQNVLQLAVRQRLKVFFRPLALGMEKNEAIKEVEWSVIKGNAVQINNRSPYHISFGSGTLRDAEGKVLKDTSIEMLPPLTNKTWTFDGAPQAKYLVVDVINDYGNAIPYSISLTETASQKAKVSTFDQ